MIRKDNGGFFQGEVFIVMAVKSNLTAARTLNVLNRNGKVAQKALRQAATGMKIISAADNASGYAISERMRAELRALDQANQNVQNGSALLKTGARGISNIVDNLRSLKELAINAANDSNTNTDRSLIQTEFVQRIANINDIALKTNYNGRVLLDGTYSKKSSATAGTSQTSETSQTVGAKIISAGDYTITEDGVYSLADGYTGTVTVNAQNVKLTQETPATQLSNVSIVTRAEGNSNLWIEGLNIANTEDKSIIKFQGADNYLTVKGTNIIENNTQHTALLFGNIYWRRLKNRRRWFFVSEEFN